jgi:hypothetical protein
MPVTSELWRLRKEDLEFEASLGYIVRQSQPLKQKNKIQVIVPFVATFVLFCFFVVFGIKPRASHMRVL